MRRLLKSSVFWFGLATIVLLSAGLGITWWQWDWLRSGSSETASNGDTLRNAGLVLAGVLALVFGWWRALVAEQQNVTARSQAKTAQQSLEQEKASAQRQADIAQRSLLNERFERGTEMLGSEVLAVRLGGIGALEGLAEQHPEQYHVTVMKRLCSFVRHPTEVKGQPRVHTTELEIGPAYNARTAQDYAAAGSVEIEVVTEDIQLALDAITSCHTRNLQVETQHNYRLDLHGADLRGVNLSNKDLSGDPDPDEAAPVEYTMIGTMRTNLRGVRLDHAQLRGTNLTGSDLSRASGLTQWALDDAYAEDRMPPVLDYAFDAVTGAALVWRKSDGNRQE